VEGSIQLLYPERGGGGGEIDAETRDPLVKALFERLPYPEDDVQNPRGSDQSVETVKVSLKKNFVKLAAVHIKVRQRKRVRGGNLQKTKPTGSLRGETNGFPGSTAMIGRKNSVARD